MESMKKCSKCGENKELKCFYRHKKHKDGLSYSCKECVSKQRLKYYTDNKTKQDTSHKKYYEKNRDSLLMYKKEWLKKNKEKMSKKVKEWCEKNKETLSAKRKIYYKENKERISANGKIYNKNNKKKTNLRRANRKKTDVDYKLTCNLRGRLYTAIKRNYKSGSAVKDLGCTIPELKKHLESQFTEGMTWDNWARKGWHIDHVKPLASFNLENREELLKACNYKNLQPLWAEDNLRKGSKYE